MKLTPTEKYAISECEKNGEFTIDKMYLRIYQNLIDNGIFVKKNLIFETNDEITLELTKDYKRHIDG